MTEFFSFLAGLSVGGGVMFALFAYGVFKIAEGQAKPTVVIHPEQGGPEAKVIDRHE